MTMVEALNKIMKNKKKSAYLRLSYYPFLLAVKDHVLQEEDMLKRKRELNNFLDKLYGESRRYLLKYAKDKYYCVCGKTFSSAYQFYTHVFTEHKPTVLKN